MELSRPDVWISPQAWRPLAVAVLKSVRKSLRANGRDFSPPRLRRELAESVPGAREAMYLLAERAMRGSILPRWQHPGLRIEFFTPRLALHLRADARAALVQAVLDELEGAK